MTANFLWAVGNHLWQSTAFAAAAALGTLALSKNRARVRHAVWLAASLKFLIPFALLVALGARIGWREAAPGPIAVAIEAAATPFGSAVFPAHPRPTAEFPWANVLAGVWACGIAGFAATWWVRWRRIALRARAGSPIDLGAGMHTLLCAGSAEPGVFGVLRPILLLPGGIAERLTSAQLQAVIAHERAHVREHDNLATAAHMLVETLFWFHPLVWWMGRRMLEERELACDEAVVEEGRERRLYAEAILEVCRLYTESPLECAAGVAGANLRRRIEGIMTKQTVDELGMAKKCSLALAGAMTLAVPVAIGMWQAPAARAQVPAPVVRAQAMQTAAAPTPQAPATQARPAAVPAPPDAAKLSPAMNRIARQYGEPDSKIATTESDIWRYNAVKAFDGSSAEFEFPRSGAGMRINWPPPRATFTGQPKADFGTVQLANAIQKESHRPEVSELAALAIPDGHASILVYPGPSNAVLTALTVPMQSLTGPVDVIARVMQAPPEGSAPDAPARPAASLRDMLGSPLGTYQAQFTLEAGSYTCQLLVRENTSGKIYTEEIAFEVK